MPYSASQKRAIAELREITGLSDTDAVRYLKITRFNFARAVDQYFSSGPATDAIIAPLNNVFDSYRDVAMDEDDKFGTEGAMKYFSHLEVQLDEVVCIGVAELCKCPAMGEFTRDGFVNGWRSVNASSVQRMKSHVRTLRKEITTDTGVFRRVYRYCFLLSRMQGQRNVQFDIAAEQWGMFFSPKSGGVAANTETTPWLDWWIEFLEGRGRKPVNKDLWEQFEVFLRKAHEDEQFGWWSPDGAWPGVLDDFVAHVQAKRGGTQMEMDMEMEIE